MNINNTLIRHTKEAAAECKHYFGDDYSMYRSYCAQFRAATLQEQCINIRILPLSFKQYKQL